MNIHEGVGLFVFSDPGGAKPLLAYVSNIHRNLYTIVSDRSYDFFADFNLLVRPLTKEAGNLIDEINPDFVLTGTSYTSSIELLFVREAQKRGIPTFSFIDHYTNLKERFVFDGEFVFPDTVLLIDSYAENIARQVGLDKNSRLLITGNYYHQYLEKWKPSVPRNKFRETIDAGDNKVLLFAPDPLSNINGKSRFGFDETDVLEVIIEVIDSLPDWVLYVKMHPNQNPAVLESVLTGVEPGKIRSKSEYHLNTMLSYADSICGMFSNILIESSILNNSVFRIIPKQSVSDPMKGKNSLPVLCSAEQIHSYLDAYKTNE